MKGIILMANGFEETEAIVTIDIIRRANIEIHTISLMKSNDVLGAHNILIKTDNNFKNISNANGLKIDTIHERLIFNCSNIGNIDSFKVDATRKSMIFNRFNFSCNIYMFNIRTCTSIMRYCCDISFNF